MHEHHALIEGFYDAFSRRDADHMAACYHPEAHFSDPVFTDLRGEEVGRMWKMLCARGKDLKIEFSGVQADAQTGRAHWDATYTFGATGRLVHNSIDASFRFEDGKIIEHRDVFDLWRWSRMALGPSGVLLGWTPMVRNKIRHTAAKSLADYRP